LKRLTVVFAALLIFISVAQADTPSQAPKHTKTVGPEIPAAPVLDVRGTEKTPLVITGAIETSLPPPPTPSQVAADTAKATDDHSLSIATIWLAILTAVLAVIAFFQLWLFLRQLRLAERAARDAEVAANAAKASAEILPKIERAYVFVEVFIGDVTIIERNFHYSVAIKVRFTNHGKTPAILTKVRAYAVFSDDSPSKLIDSDRADRQVPEGLVIGAGGDYELDLPQDLTQQDWADLHDVIRRPYLVGVVEYKDVMGATHHTGFCWVAYYKNDELTASISPSPLNSYD
jgi:hypothetical protein